jgi:hypothetical protein
MVNLIFANCCRNLKSINWSNLFRLRAHEDTTMKKILLCVAILMATLSSANADIITGYNLAGATGDQAFTAATIEATNVSGLDLTRGPGLTATAAGNSFSASGWNAGEYFSFGFTVDSGFFVELANLEIGTRSSSTGPGTMGLFSSVDNFGTAITTISQASGGNFVNSSIDLTALGQLSGTVEFRLAMIGTGAANGGTVAGTGTFRVTNYFAGGDQGSFRFNGSVSAVPEPTSAGLLALTGVAGLAFRRRRS